MLLNFSKIIRVVVLNLKLSRIEGEIDKNERQNKMINERDFVMSLIAISQSEKMLPRTLATFTATKNYVVTAKQQNKSTMRIYHLKACVPIQSIKNYKIINKN